MKYVYISQSLEEGIGPVYWDNNIWYVAIKFRYTVTQIWMSFCTLNTVYYTTFTA